jgi:hypothetical protein
VQDSQSVSQRQIKVMAAPGHQLPATRRRPYGLCMPRPAEWPGQYAGASDNSPGREGAGGPAGAAAWPQQLRRGADPRRGRRLLLGPAGRPALGRHPAPAQGTLLVVGPAALLHPKVRQPDGRAVYDLLTGHPARESRELVFLADLAVELREWQGTDWATLGVDVEGVAEALVLLARRGQVRARWYHGLSAEEVKALGRPAMEDAREQLRGRLAGWLSEQELRWLHPTSGRRPGEPFL